MKYEKKIYDTGFAVEVDPPERSVDVLHYLTTGYLLGGRSLDGVTWKDAPEGTKDKWTRALERSMKKAKV